MSTFATLSAVTAATASLSPSREANVRRVPLSFDLSSCAPADTIKLVAVYLERLTVANDGVTKGDLTRFHARTIPTIDILAYLQRILKYAPCGNEVFLAVLVYFDRISRRANALLDAQAAAAAAAAEAERAGGVGVAGPSTPSKPAAAGGVVATMLVPDSPSSASSSLRPPASPSVITAGLNQFQPFKQPNPDRQPMEGVDPPSLHANAMAQQYDPADDVEFTMSKKRKRKVLIINSYNVHRLLITGVMVASKLFSDVFFLNSHYAKVGGLPVMELNQLELEFLIFNDFNLHITVEELQRTGDALMSHASDVYQPREGTERGMLLRESIIPFNESRPSDAKRFPRDADRDDGGAGSSFGGGGSGSSLGGGGSGGVVQTNATGSSNAGGNDGDGTTSSSSLQQQQQQYQHHQANNIPVMDSFGGRQPLFHQASPPYDHDSPSKTWSTAPSHPIATHPQLVIDPARPPDNNNGNGYPPSPAASDEQHATVRHDYYQGNFPTSAAMDRKQQDQRTLALNVPNSGQAGGQQQQQPGTDGFVYGTSPMDVDYARYR